LRREGVDTSVRREYWREWAVYNTYPLQPWQ
jgi:hypothetical protein